MFGNNAKKDGIMESITPSNGSGSSTINSLGFGTKIEGKIIAGSDIRIDGSLVGSLECKGKVIIGPKGNIDGNIDCKNAVVEGTFQGQLSISELLTVKESANISGEIKTGQLIVQSGAIFNVTCTMGGQKIAKSPVPTSGNKEKPVIEFSKT